MKNCEYCGDAIRGKRKTARFCSDFCRLKAFRDKNGSRYQSRKDSAENTPQNIKSYTCCKSASFYSPTFRWGDILICDNCGAVWGRLDEPKKPSKPGNLNVENK